MLEDYEEFISLTLRTRNSKKPLRTLEKLEHQCLPPSLARQARRVSMVRPVARLMISNQNLRVSWKPVNPPDCVFKNHIAGNGDNSLQHHNLVHKFIPMLQAMKTPAAKAAVDKEWEELEKIPAWDLTKVRSKSEVIDEARTKGAKVHFASLMDIYRLKNAESEARHQKIQRSNCTPRWYCKKTIQGLMQYSLNKDLQHLKWQRLRSWISSPDCQVAMDKQQTQYQLIPK